MNWITIEKGESTEGITKSCIHYSKKYQICIVGGLCTFDCPVKSCPSWGTNTYRGQTYIKGDGGCKPTGCGSYDQKECCFECPRKYDCYYPRCNLIFPEHDEELEIEMEVANE